MYLKRLKFVSLVLFTLCFLGCDGDLTSNKQSPDEDLKIVVIRHAEKSKDGDNLSCQGQNRALQLASVLVQKINKPSFTYVPALKSDKSTKHSRMFQTITPFAIKYNVAINSKYSADENEKIVKSVFFNPNYVFFIKI